MTKAKKAAELRSQGLNCCQSVLAVFCEDLGLSEEMALKISSGFGGGMRQGEVCGAVSGAIMAIGLKYGHTSGNDNQSKAKTDDTVIELFRRFKTLNNLTKCKELLGCDTSTDEGKKYAKEHNVVAKICPKLISDAITITEELLK